MPDLPDLQAAERFLFASYLRARPYLRGGDERVRRPELTAELLARLGNPERGLPCLLVAGSKGKGSTAAFAAGLLGAGGTRVGLFSSPHLLDVRERIRIDGRAIPPADFVRLVNQVAEPATPLAASLPAETYLSPLGLMLCVALLHFRERGVDLAVIEAGRGARFDDTRLVEHPVAAITRLMREHPHELGRSLATIASHKAGAIPTGGTVISVPQRGSALEVLRREASVQGSDFLLLGQQVTLRHHPTGAVDVTTPRRSYPALQPALRGPHQAENLALALAAAEALQPALARLPLSAIQRAVARVRWPGRCETLQQQPLVLLDGAVNAASGRAFLAAALPISRPPIVAVSAVPADKDYRGLFRVLVPHLTALYVTRASNPHLRFPDRAVAEARRLLSRVTETPDLATAVRQALPEVTPDGTLWIVGTQSLVADALRLWQRNLEDLGEAEGGRREKVQQ